jgi:integrase
MDDTPFLISNRGQRLGHPLSERQTHRVFNMLRDNLDWVNRGAHNAPRLHDLRHTFAVRRMMIWHEEETDIDLMMLALSTYMGHAKICYTYWYLTAVPELMALAASKFERFAVRSAYIFLSRRFSFSSSFIRAISDASIPLYLARHL